MDTRENTITPPKAAECLNMTHRTLLRYIERGVLPAIALKRLERTLYRIRINELRAFAQKHELPFNEEPLLRESRKAGSKKTRFKGQVDPEAVTESAVLPN